MPSPAPPVVMTIAGSDCCAGAGLQADLKTCTTLGVHGLTVVTAVVAETPAEVTAIEAVPPAVVQEQLRLLLDSYPVAVVKTGMLVSKAHIVAVSEILAESKPELVVDPVMIASTGDPLLEDDAVAAYRDRLLPLTTVMTPNIPEAETLLGYGRGTGKDPGDLAKELFDRFQCAALVKGGHETDAEVARDVLVGSEGESVLEGPWIDCASAHGTGCTLSAALAAFMAKGNALTEAARLAKEFVSGALRHHYRFAGPSGLVALNQLPVHSREHPGDCNTPSSP